MLLLLHLFVFFSFLHFYGTLKISLLALFKKKGQYFISELRVNGMNTYISLIIRMSIPIIVVCVW